MQEVYPNQANVIGLPIVAKATGDPIITGTINFYLVRLDTGKWFRGSDSSWQSAEALAGVGTHRADGHWYTNLVAAAWVINKRYRLYAKESGDLHIPVGEEIQCRIIAVGQGVSATNYYVYTDEDLETGPIGDCKVWITTDITGSNVIASGYTDNLGKVVFYLDAGTYYFWRKKTGYNFTNPDTEIIL